MRPPTWARTTKPTKKKSRKTPASDAVLCNAICAYSLAKKNTGMNAIMAISNTRFSTANGLIRKISTLMSGDAVWSSTSTNRPMIASPAMMQTHVPGLLQLHRTDCWRPKMLSPIPTAIRTAPR